MPNRLIRFLSRRKTGRGINRGTQQQVDPKQKKHVIVCTVVLLDGTNIDIELPKKALGEALAQRVFYHLDLLETSYFGLQYTDASNVNHWLDPTKKIKKQVQIGPPYTLRLRVKFFPLEPTVLKEELTRYQFFLQCKADLLKGSLECDDEVAVELAALALQSELGDFDEEEHTPAYISEFRFVPRQNEQMELEIYNQYQSLRGHNMTPDKAEMQYLHKCKLLEMYGVDMHYVLGRDSRSYKLGLTPTGVLVFEGDEKIGLFYWPKITKFNFKRKKLILVVVEDSEEGVEVAPDQQREHTFVFRTENPKACKHLWKCAIEHHTFFRVVVTPAAQRGRQGFIRLGSRFRYSGRTQFEQLNRSQARRSVRFERQPSKRFSRRQSLEARERIKKGRRPPGAPQTQGSTSATTPETPTLPVNTNGATLNGRGGSEPNSPMDRLDNLIANKERNGSTSTRSSNRETSPPSDGKPAKTVLEHSEAAQARIKGLETPEPPPRPTKEKDVNLYQNNQVKIVTKDKVPIEMKSNNLKARNDEARFSGKKVNNTAERTTPKVVTSPTIGGASAVVMHEDDDVSTESEDEGPLSPISGPTPKSAYNGSRVHRNASTSSNKSAQSPGSANNLAGFNFTRDQHTDSAPPPVPPHSKKALALLAGKPMAISPPLNEPPSPEVFDSPPSPSPESTVNPLFDSPEIRAFLFDTSDNLLSDLANGRSLETSFEADDERFREASYDSSRAKNLPRSESTSSTSKTNGDVKPRTPSVPTPAPRKYEKRVCITTEL